MREILFRGKRIYDGKWSESTYPYGEIHGGTVTYDYFPESVRQYTGLTDKNGKKIFEGDIISTPKYGIDNGNGHNFSGKDKFVVGFADGTYHLENKLRKFCLRPDSTCEVIGNIFDNQELLKEGE